MYRHFLAPLSLGLSALLIFLLVQSTWRDSYPITNVKLFIESALGINHPLARKANPLPLQLPASTEATSQYTVTTQPTMHFVGIEKKVDVNNKLFTRELTNAWQAYARNAKTIGIKNKVNNSVYIIYSDYSPLPKGYISVFLAYRVSEYADIPADFDTLTVPRHSYAIFNVNQRHSPQIAACWDKINRFNLNRTYRYDMESYPSNSSTSYIGLAMWLCSVVSFWMFGRAMTFFDLGSLLALFMGIGLLIITLISYFLFNETLSFWKTISIILTVFGVVGLCLTTSSQS